MNESEADRAHALAGVVAMMVVSDAGVDAREIERLAGLDAFARLGMTRAQFVAVAEAFAGRMGPALGRGGKLRKAELEMVDDVLDGVEDRERRLIACRLAAAIVGADGRVQGAERLIYEHMLVRWGIEPGEVSA